MHLPNKKITLAAKIAIMEYFKNRRTIRQFSREIPSDSLLREILDDAMRAPTTGNMQLYSVIVSKSPEMLEKLRPLHFNQPASQAPVLLTVCADIARFERWCSVSNATPGFRNFQSLMAGILDATMFAQQVVTIAEMHGLATCYLGTVTYNAPGIAEVLRLPAGVIPVACIALGYPAANPAQCERLPLEAVAFDETYPEFSDADIKRLYSDKDTFPDNRKFIEENGKETLAQVFTDVRYPKDTNEQFSDIYLGFIRKQGFDI